jgi:hypothetical protein
MKSKGQSETTTAVGLAVEKKNVWTFDIFTSFDIWILKFGFKNSTSGLSILEWGKYTSCLRIFAARWFRADH